MFALLWFGAGMVALADAVRRPQAAWVAADRSKSFWVTLVVIAGGICAIAYAVAALPQLHSLGSSTATDPYRKHG